MKKIPEQATRSNYQQSEFRRIKREMFVEDAVETLKRLSSPKVWLTAIGGLGLLSACAPPIEATQPQAKVITLEEGILIEETEAVQETVVLPTLEITSTATPEPTPIVEPTTIPLSNDTILPIEPPNFVSFESLENGAFDLVDAHAIYAWYRQQQGPAMWASDTDFIADMESYAAELEKQGIELKQATVEGQTFSLLTKENDILLNFNTDGALQDSDPGRWSIDSTPQWVDVGGPVDLFIGADGHAYIAKVDKDGNVIAFLNTVGATLDNVNDQWIPVQDGLPNAIWDGEAWSSEIPIRAFAGTYHAGIESGTYTFLTLDELKEFPGQLTPADMRDPNLGPLIRQNLTDEIYGVWLIGRVVGSKSGHIIINSQTGETVKFLELIMDVPDISRKSALRFEIKIRTDSFISPMINLPNLQTGTNQLRALGIDPLSGDYDPTDLLVPGESLYIIDSYTPDQRMDILQNNPDFIGSLFGFLMPNTSFQINRDTKEQTVTPNLPLKILTEPSFVVDQQELNKHTFDYFNYAADPDNLQ